MNNQQISQLKRMLKKYGIKNAESIVRGAIEFNYNRFLELAEPIYVVSRIQSCYTNQREVSMLDKANLEWVGLVVDGGWCGALLPYIEKYGATITKKAIQYLIENKMWDAYDGKTALKTKGANHYKGFEDIHAAAEYVKELEPPKDDTTETAEITKHDGDTEKASDEVSDLSEKAFEASETIKKLLTDAIGNFDIINEFIVMRCNTTKVENELKALQKTLAKFKKSSIEKIEKEIEWLQLQKKHLQGEDVKSEILVYLTDIANEIEPYILRVTKSKCMPSLAKDYLMEAVDLCYQKVIDKKILVQSPRKWLSFATRNFVYCKEKAVKLRNI